MVGVVNATRAEHSASQMSDRYIALLVPEQQLRASIAQFQMVADAAYASTGSDAGLLPAAVQQSNITDRSYVTLEHLLMEPANTDLAPAVISTQKVYSSSRTALALLIAGANAPQAASVQVSERAAYNNFDSALAALETAIDAGLAHSAQMTQTQAGDARLSLLWSIGLGGAFGVAITALLSRKALLEERTARQRDSAQARLARRGDFEGQVQRALEMAKSETPVFALVAESLADAAPGMYSELLLADSSRAHFRQVLATGADPGETGCGVISPDDCPAAGRGQSMVFSSSAAIDACPNLRGRGHSALCVPVSISGKSVGVVHVTTADGTPPDDAVRSDVEVVARRASERLAVLRAFELSQTQANSDSLTGLLTRRSLEARARDLRDSGAPYAVAYCDLDHFKQLNDVYGHDTGDRSLRMFAQVLRDALRPSDIPCRYGGEEFVIILPTCPLFEAVHVLQRVRQQIAVRLDAGHLPIFTASFGVASSDQADDFVEVVALADGALLQAKANGRDQIVLAGERVVPALGPAPVS